jgi:hypothetical protein
LRGKLLGIALACLAPAVTAASPLTVAVIIHQEQGDSRWAEGLLQKALQGQGYRIVSVSYREWLALRDAAIAREASGRRAAIAERWRFRAQVLIFGTATLSSSLPDSEGLALRSAHLVVEGYQTDTGELFGTYPAHAKRAHVDEVTGGNQALERCIEEILPRLLNDLETIKGRSESEDARRSAMIRLRVLGVQSMAEADGLLKKLMALKAVREARIEGFTLNVANYEVHGRGDSKQLGQDLEKVRLGGMKLEILEVTPQTVRGRLTPQ